MAFAVSAILSDVALRTTSPPFSTTTRVTTAQATAWVTQSYRALMALLQDRFPGDAEYAISGTVSTTAGVRTVALPSSTLEHLIAVIWVRDTYDHVLLKSAQLEDLADRPDKGWDEVEPRYSLLGETLEFSPAPKTVETLIVYYTDRTKEGTIASPGTFEARTDHDEWITLDVSAKVQRAKNKLQEAAALIAERDIIEQRMLSRMRDRDASRVVQVRDVRRDAALHAWRKYYGIR